MSILVVKFLLPALLGYTLYAAMANKLSFSRPANEKQRPAWFLALWTSLAITGVLIASLHMAYGSSIEAARALLPMAGLALAALLSVGLMITMIYRAELRSPEPSLAADRIDLFGEQDLADSMPQSTSALVTDSDDVGTNEIVTLEKTVDNTSVASEQSEIEAERAQRADVERHLLITRKALHRLESQPRNDVAHQSTISELEVQLTESTKAVAAAHSLAERESFTRIASENTVNELRQDIVKIQSDLRKSIEARARALSTANKSVAYARSASHARSRAEARISELETALRNRQETISSLIRTLEKEKRRSQDEVSRRARELILHERQIRSRRSLEEVSRSVEGNLTTRLVKKVARSRTLASDS
jgi:hypothetical protein